MFDNFKIEFEFYYTLRKFDILQSEYQTLQQVVGAVCIEALYET